MKHFGKSLLLLGTVLFSLTLTANMNRQSTDAHAATAKVLKVRPITKTAYRTSEGYIYKNAKLTKKKSQCEKLPANRLLFDKTSHHQEGKRENRCLLLYS